MKKVGKISREVETELLRVHVELAHVSGQALTGPQVCAHLCALALGDEERTTRIEMNSGSDPATVQILFKDEDEYELRTFEYRRKFALNKVTKFVAHALEHGIEVYSRDRK